VVTATTVHM